VRHLQQVSFASLSLLVCCPSNVAIAHSHPTTAQNRTEHFVAGGCTEDCKYCSQSSSYKTPTKASRLVDIEPVLEAARQAKANGSTRFCMGAAWRDLAGRKSGFEKILKMVKEVRAMDMEGGSGCFDVMFCSCAERRVSRSRASLHYSRDALARAGPAAQRGRPQRVQPQPRHVARVLPRGECVRVGAQLTPQVITTRSYDERLSTIEAVRAAGISVCSGGILGLGEKDEDRVGLIHEVSRWVGRGAHR
jgi:biotin synthase